MPCSTPARRTIPSSTGCITKYRYIPFSYIYLGYNLEDSRFADRRVRQALTYAINKKELIDGVLMGLGEEAYGPYKPGTWYYNPNVPKFSYDPDKAKALLAAAGWQPNADGILTKDGRPFEFTILTNQGNDTRVRTAEIIQSRLRAGGHPGEDPHRGVGRLPQGIHRKGALRGGPPGLEHRPGPGPVRHLALLQDQARGTQFHPLQKLPRWTACWTRAATPSTGRNAARPISSFQEILAEDQPYTFLFVPDALPAISKRFRGIKPAPAGHRLQLHQVVRAQGRAEVHHVAVLSADGKDHRPNRQEIVRQEQFGNHFPRFTAIDPSNLSGTGSGGRLFFARDRPNFPSTSCPLFIIKWITLKIPAWQRGKRPRGSGGLAVDFSADTPVRSLAYRRTP